MASATDNLDQRIAAVRGFNRFYTRQIGLLHEGLLDSPFSLTQVRVLYEVAHRDKPTAAEIGSELRLDAGYLSRILSSFAKRKLIEKKVSETDGRQSLLSLTKRGRETLAPLEARSAEQVAQALSELSAAEQGRLIGAMGAIENLLGARADAAKKQTPYLIRPPQPGDLGWVVHRHGVLYAREYGYDQTFEALVAEIVAKFVQHYDAKGERCWIADRDGEIVGSVFLVGESKTVAKLRLLLVEPSARGLGIGSRLVSECVRFARQAGYKKISLWTQSELDAARRVYKKAGFQVTGRERHHSFGKDLVAETWELPL
jgi:DNA-binding MarR family transcriptional regulator/ribosomal protein S18 acetylase RimI-like enzyme